ncbi:MAG: 50S ribosomal protein L10 [candidate division Zixibacteria bacterium]
MDKDQKQQEVASLKEKLTKAVNVIITDHTGINVADISVLPGELKGGGAEFRVAKNTLLKLAVKDTDLEALQKHFVGPTSVVLGYDDPTVPVKIVYDSIKKTEKPVFKSLLYEGNEYDFAFFKRLAELPPKDQVLAGLVATLDGVISQFISVVEGATRDLIGTLDALAESKK